MGSESSAPGRAHTDFLTGSLHLLDIPTNTLFDYIMENRLPASFLPSFLHEATHFWCGSSALGMALAFLEMRAQREVFAEAAARSRLIHDLGVVDAVNRILKPLFEGMALFTEFDTLPGAANMFSSPSFWAAAIFAPLNEPPPAPADRNNVDWANSKVTSILADYRLGQTALQRKIDTLMRPLSGDPHFYLAGYLTVKHIWQNAAFYTPLLHDRDLFLAFLREWVFQDWKLIDAVLNEDLRLGTAVYLFSDRLQSRLVQLATTDLSKEVAEFDRLGGPNSENFSAMLEVLQLSRSEIQPAIDRHNALFAELYEGMRKEEEGNNWFFADVMTLEHRHKMMRLALEKVEVEVNEHGRVQVRRGASIEETYLSGEAPPEAEIGVTPGWITVYYVPDFKRMILLAVRRNQPMVWLPAPEIPEDEFLKQRFAITKVIATEEGRREFAAISRKVVQDLQDEGYEKVFFGLDDFVDRVYANYALSNAPEDRLAILTELLARRGLYDLLEKNGDLLTALAQMSLFPVVNDALRPLVKSKLQASDIELSWAIERLNEINDKTGFMLIFGDETIWCKV